MRSKTSNWIACMVIVMSLWACKKNIKELSSISNQQIGFAQQLNEEFPFADTQTLKSFAADQQILNYQYAKKLALVELVGTGEWATMQWEGASLSETPVMIYGFDSKPKFYEYIVLDPEKKAIGAVMVYAQKKSNTMVRSISKEVPDFNQKITKSGSVRIFQDWTGMMYTATPSRSGAAPTQIISETGEAVSNVRELSDEEIAQQIATTVLKTIKQSNDSFLLNMPDSLKGTEIAANIAEASQQDAEAVLLDNMNNMHQQRDSFWMVMATMQDSIENITTTDITEKSTKGLFSWLRQVFTGVDTRTYGNGKYDYRNYMEKINGKNNPNYIERVGWCGAWVANYLHVVKWGIDKSDRPFFERASSTSGLFGLAWIFKSPNFNPMWPNEFAWSLLIKSFIGVSPVLHFDASQAYWHVRNTGQPVIRLCSAEGELHWTLCYQVQQGGSRFWTQYKFRQIDNGSKIYNLDEFTEMDWWNLYLKVLWT